MQKKHLKYFWDGTNNISEEFEVRRIFEYASFPDLIQFPFNKIKQNIDKIYLEKLRTGEKRKKILILLKPFIHASNSWDEAISQFVSKSIILK